MVRGTLAGHKILEYLQAVYPQAQTIEEICGKTAISRCSAGGWLKTLVSRRRVEICGKKGRFNLYRCVPETKGGQ